MNIKKTLLAAALAAFAFSAMPAFASAEVTAGHIKFANENGNRDFTIDTDVDGEGDPTHTTRLSTPEISVDCTSFTGTGSVDPGGTTGKIKLTFHHCTAFGFLNCTTAGQSTGTITTTELPFHIEPVNEEPAVLITPNNGHFATFACFGSTTKVEGTGVIGTITDPGWTGEPTDEATVTFSQTGGVQDHLTTDTNGTEYDLIANRSGTKETAAQEGAGVLTFNQNVTLEDTGETTKE